MVQLDTFSTPVGMHSPLQKHEFSGFAVPKNMKIVALVLQAKR